MVLLCQPQPLCGMHVVSHCRMKVLHHDRYVRHILLAHYACIVQGNKVNREEGSAVDICIRATYCSSHGRLAHCQFSNAPLGNPHRLNA